MTEFKHTPGPWHVVIDDCGPLAGRPLISASDELDCVIVHWDGFAQGFWRSARGDKEIHANARLIAKAPEMLELINDIVGTHDDGAYPEYVANRIQEARALIAEIKGDAS